MAVSFLSSVPHIKPQNHKTEELSFQAVIVLSICVVGMSLSEIDLFMLLLILEKAYQELIWH